MKTLKLIQGRFRLFFHFCPACNSDAPKKDNCKICDNFYGCADAKLRKTWWNKFEADTNKTKDK